VKQAITENDLARVVQAFALAAIDPTQWLPALSLASDTIGAVCSALEYVDLNTGAAAMESSLQIEDSVLRDYEERIFHINPRVRLALPLRVGKVAGDRQLRWDDDPAAPELIDWLEKTPYFYLEGAKILDSGGHIAFFASHFSRKGGPDELSERFHRAIVPHLINMHEAGRALSGNRLRNELVTHRALDGDKPFALLDRAGRLAEVSPGFEAALNSGDLLALRGRQLVGRHHCHSSLVERFLQSAVGARRLLDPPLPIRLTGPANPRGLVLRAVPLPPREDIFDIFRPAALVTIVDLDAPTKVRRRELSALFGLTGREADVAASIAEGCSIERAAATLSISQYTVKQHLKTVFAKMCIERQSDLVAIVSRLA
jgi:DNA-binding CsgD family transcriptional regulator